MGFCAVESEGAKACVGIHLERPFNSFLLERQPCESEYHFTARKLFPSTAHSFGECSTTYKLNLRSRYRLKLPANQIAWTKLIKVYPNQCISLTLGWHHMPCVNYLSFPLSFLQDTSTHTFSTSIPST